jgi:hypothetical protein
MKPIPISLSGFAFFLFIRDPYNETAANPAQESAGHRFSPQGLTYPLALSFYF